MGEYAPLVRRLGGQVIEIAPGSPSHINPMDIQLDLDDDESPLSMKADFLLSLCELVVGGKDGLQPIEKTVIDRCVRLIYRDMALGIGDGKPPLLQDLYEELLKQPEPEARRVATALELYCTGSLNLFNHPTNVDLTARVVCIVLKGLGENLRKIAMHITNDFVTSAVNVNFHSGISTWCYFDEFHILLRDALTASYFVAVWKMLRKKGCVPSALTQNVKDLLASREIEAILDNTDFMILLAQAQSDRAILAKQLGISEHQLSYITHSNSGEGLLFYGDVTIPFVDRFPKGEIYNLLTTRPEDLKHEAKRKRIRAGGARRLGGTSTSGQSVHKSKFRQKSKQEQAAASKLRMEKRGEKLEKAKDKLAKQKPPKKPGPVRRVGRAGGRGRPRLCAWEDCLKWNRKMWAPRGLTAPSWWASPPCGMAPGSCEKKVREHPAKAVHKAESKYIKATADYHFRMAAQEHPEMSGNSVSRMWRKHRLKKQYQKKAREAAKTGAASAAKKTAAATEKAGAKIAGFVKRHPVGVLLALACLLLLFVMQSCSSSLVMLGNSGAGAVGATTYPSKDEDILAAEASLFRHGGGAATLPGHLRKHPQL